MFNQGDIVKCKLRSNKAPLFLMVIYDLKPNEIQFNAVVIKDLRRDSRLCECGKSERECYCDF